MQLATNFSESFTTIYEDELAFLEKTNSDYPVSSLSLFLLLQNYKRSGNGGYDQLIRRAALHFPNHTWLNYQLSEDKSMNHVPETETNQELNTHAEIIQEDEITFSEADRFEEYQLKRSKETNTELNPGKKAMQEMEIDEMVELAGGEEGENFVNTHIENESVSGSERAAGGKNQAEITEEQNTNFAEADNNADTESAQNAEINTEVIAGDEEIPLTKKNEMDEFPGSEKQAYVEDSNGVNKSIAAIENKEEEENNAEKLEENESSFAVSSTFPDNKSEKLVEATTVNTSEAEAIREMENEEMVEFVREENAENFEDSFVENESFSKVEIKEEEDTNSEIKEKNEPNFGEAALNPENKSEQYVEATTANNSEEKATREIETEEMVDFADSKEADNLEKTFDENELKEEVKSESGKEAEVPSSPKDIHAPNVSESIQADMVPAQGISVSAIQNSAGKQESAGQNQQIEFEPLHTIDYFASQGIIIREEALMNDKLGKQMKSFTDWLKSMKKIHPGKLPDQNEVVEKIIQSSAELSNEDAGILTEAMADVLIKQGKKAKAIEMFEKLSLMNPSKSIYFAAKIESLKK